jgi:hypothetical protein
MAVVICLSPPAMTTAQYDEAISRLDEAGAGEPPGRVLHLCYGPSGRLRILTVWDRPESFERFGQTLVPILQELGADPGEPEIYELHKAIPEVAPSTG